MKHVILLTALVASISSSESLKMYVQRKKKERCPAIQEGCCADQEEGYLSKWFFDACFPTKDGSMMYRYRETEGTPGKIDVGEVSFASNDCSGPMSIRLSDPGVSTETCDDEFKYDLVELSDEDVAGLFAVVVVPQPQNSDLCSTYPTLAAWFENIENPQILGGAMVGSGAFCLTDFENRTGFDGDGNILLYPEDNCQGTPTSVTCYSEPGSSNVAYAAKMSEYLALYEARVGNTLRKQTYGLGVFKQYAEETCETEIGFSGTTLYGFCIPSGDGVSSTQVFYEGIQDQFVRPREEEEESFFVQLVQYQDPKCASLPVSTTSNLISSSCNNGARFFPKPIELNDLSPELDTVGVGLRARMNASFWTPTVCQDKYESASLKEAVAIPDTTAIHGFNFFSSDLCVNEGNVRTSTDYLSFRTSADGNLTYYANVNCTGAVNEEISGVCNTGEYNENTPAVELYLGASLREFAHLLAPEVFSESLTTEAPTLAPTPTKDPNSPTFAPTPPTTTKDPDGPKTSSPSSSAPQDVSVSIFLSTMVALVLKF